MGKPTVVLNLPKYFGPVGAVMAPWAKHRRTFQEARGERQYWHIPNASGKGRVLLVAHVDTVQEPVYQGVSKSRKVHATGLDDRLGVAMAFALRRERKDVDVLITDEEEMGRSTAELFPKEALAPYNFILGLDRGGMDFVHYEMATSDLIDAFADCTGAPLGQGSFSDICFLPNPEVSCLNLGIGYHNAHGKDSWASVKDLVEAYHRTHYFLDEFSGTRFPAPPPSQVRDKWWKGDDWRYEYAWSGSYKTGWVPTPSIQDDDYVDTDETCDWCDETLIFRDEVEMGLCRYCIEDYRRGMDRDSIDLKDKLKTN